MPQGLSRPAHDLESHEMTDRFRTARWTRLVLAFCLVTSSAAARSQEAESPDDHHTTADRSSGSLPGQKTRQTPTTGESTPARQHASRWQRFRDSVWPFRPRRQSTDSERPPRNLAIRPGQRVASGKKGAEDVLAQGPERKPESSPSREERRSRWLLGRDVRYAPGEDPDTSEPSDVKADHSVSQAAYESLQDSRRSPALPSSSPGVAPAAESVPVRVGGGQDPRDLPPSLDPLPSPTPGSPVQPGIPEANGAVTDSVGAEAIAESQQEPYGLGKRFLRGYPTLVQWFPRLLGPPRESPAPEGETFRAGETFGGGG
jgi:hypothetical protein